MLRLQEDSLTDTQGGSKELPAETTKHHCTCVVDRVNLCMSKFKVADDPARPGRHRSHET